MIQIETDRDGKNGNTKHSSPPNKQGNQLKTWFFTYNNYTATDIERIETTFKVIALKYRFQEETGESGTKHLQGNVWLKKSMRFSEFKLPKEIHWEKTRNEDAAAAYCGKAETRTGSVYEYGFPKPVKVIEKLRPYQKHIEKIFLTEPDDRTVYWFWEDTGNVGKSAFCKYMYMKYGVLFCNGGKAGDLVNLVFNADMDNTKAVIWDIPRASKAGISYAAVEQIKNGLICNTKYETGNKVFNAPHIFIFANFPPQERENLSADRWRVFKIRGDDYLLEDEDGGSDLS